jgi:hypothetical protein
MTLEGKTGEGRESRKEKERKDEGVRRRKPRKLARVAVGGGGRQRRFGIEQTCVQRGYGVIALGPVRPAPSIQLRQRGSGKAESEVLVKGADMEALVTVRKIS